MSEDNKVGVEIMDETAIDENLDMATWMSMSKFHQQQL